MPEYYKTTIAGCERSLPKCSVNDKLDIAAFIMYGDVEITIKTAEALLKKCPEFDVILTAEAKGIPLAYELARQSGKSYVVAHKGLKVYMTDPITVDVTSITTKNSQHLNLSSDEVNMLKGKKVLIIDDVISTGDTLKAIEKLVELSGGTVAGKAAVFAEGDASDRSDIIYLNELPLFFK